MRELRFLAQPNVIRLALARWLFNHRQMMLCTDLIAQLANRESGSVKVPILPLPVERSGVPDNVIVNMRFINMSTDNKSKAILQKPLCKFISDSICLFRCDFSRPERLPHLVGDNIILWCAAIEDSVLALGQEKLIGNRFWVALKRRNQLTSSPASSILAGSRSTFSSW